MFYELLCDSATAFKSNSKLDYTSTPIFNFGSGIKNIVSFKVIEVTLPVSWYNWYKINTIDEAVSTDRTFTLNIGTGTANFNLSNMNMGTGVFSGSLQSAYFSGYDIAAAITVDLQRTTFTNLLTAQGYVGPYNCYCEWLPNLNKFNFVLGTNLPPPGINISIEFFKADNNSKYIIGQPGRSRAATMLGYPMGITLLLDNGLKNYSPLMAMPTLYNTVFVRSNTLGPLINALPNFSTVDGNVFDYDVQGSSSHLTMIPVSQNFGSVINWQDPRPSELFQFEGSPVISNFDIYFTLGPEKRKLDLNGASFQIKIAIETDDNYISSLKRLRTNV